MKKLCILLLVSTATPVVAADVTGDYCLEVSIQNGRDAITGEFIPRTNIFRPGSDCDENDQATISIEDGVLSIQGNRLVDLQFNLKGK